MKTEKEKFALVTGGSRGIGRAVCEQLAVDSDYHILVNYNTNATAAKEVVSAIETGGGKATAIPFNVSDSEQVTKALDDWHAANPNGLIEVVVNNAGINKDGLFMWMKTEDWKSVYRYQLGRVLQCDPLLD